MKTISMTLDEYNEDLSKARASAMDSILVQDVYHLLSLSAKANEKYPEGSFGHKNYLQIKEVLKALSDKTLIGHAKDFGPYK